MKKQAAELMDLGAQEPNLSDNEIYFLELGKLSIKEIDSLIFEFNDMIEGSITDTDGTVHKKHSTKRASKLIENIIDTLLEERFERQNMGK